MTDQKTPSPFTPELLEKIKGILLEEKERFERELSQFAEKNPRVEGDYDAQFPEFGEKDDDNAQEVEQYTVRKPLEISLEKTLRDVNNALERLDEGTYGICKYCGEPIDEKRLLARPTSSSCVSCKKTLTDEA